MPLLKDAMPLMKELHPPSQIPLPWFLPSLFAAFNVALLVILSGLFFAFPWLAQNGEWAFPIATGLLFALTFFSLISLNFSDPGILHRGSDEQSPMTVHVVWVNHRAFRLKWCPICCFHRPPRTYHCPWCNICVERLAYACTRADMAGVIHIVLGLVRQGGKEDTPDFDHHCKWINNCIGGRNFRFFLLLVLSLCLYSAAVLVTCLIFLVRTTHLLFSMDTAVAYPPERGSQMGGRGIVVAVPAAGCLVPLFPLLLIQARSVSAAERSYEGKRRYLQGNPFDHGCANNWYLTICAPLGPKYMAEAVWLQGVVGPDWVPRQNLLSPMYASAQGPPALPGPESGPQPQPLGLCKPGTGSPGSAEAAAFQELPAGPVLPLLREAPREGSGHLSPLHTQQRLEPCT
ncbi:hypothetical protein MC885_020221 [Smutsia gigantea]|nr:hypothetical protein MC885_020221 [Smutsia gigantea]